MTFQRILCPLDLDAPTERRVFDYALATAHGLGASLHVLHVYDLPGYIHPPIDSKAAKSYEQRALSRSREALDALLATETTVPLTGALHPGVPHRRIAEEVARLGIDAIVMGTHARAGLSRFVLGSVAERVLRTAAVPVLTVPFAQASLTAPARSLLVPHDFSSCSRRAFELARRLHKSLHASIAAVHVLPASLGDAAAPGYVEASDPARYREALERELARDVDEIMGPEAQVVTTRMLEGPVVDQIREASEALDVDLVVIGASGKSAVERVLLGSVTAELLRVSAIPVLTVP